jgi:hypothetical protein
MKKIVKLWIYENDDGSFIGETDAILIKTNIPELAGTSVEFWDDSKEGVVQQVLDYFKRKGEHGILRIV